MSHKPDLGGNSPGVNLGLIITPMLDMAFQLMAFFIMTFQPLSEEKNITGRLLPPRKEEKAQQQSDPANQPNNLPPPEVLDVVRVIVEINDPNETDPKKNSGKPGRILLKFPEDAQPELIADLGTSFETGLNKLTRKLNERGGRDHSKLQVEAHPNLRYQYFIQLQDVCRAAGFKEMPWLSQTELADQEGLERLVAKAAGRVERRKPPGSAGRRHPALTGSASLPSMAEGRKSLP